MIGYSGRKRACRKHELDGYREDEESQLTERLNTQQRKVAWKGHGAESINGEEQKVQDGCRRH
jgi:hypothetical protein